MTETETTDAGASAETEQPTTVPPPAPEPVVSDAASSNEDKKPDTPEAEQSPAAAAEAAAATEADKAAAAPKTKEKGKAASGKKPAKPRAIGPVEKQPDAAELRELIGMAQLVEIAFSDGKREIAALAPVVVHGDAWVAGVTGLRLRVDELMVMGPLAGAAIEVKGFGLVLDGELYAYRERFEPMHLKPGQRANLADEFVF